MPSIVSRNKSAQEIFLQFTDKRDHPVVYHTSMKPVATLLLFVSFLGTFVLMAGVLEEEPEPKQVVIPIESIHKDVTTRFIKSLGFGFSRMIRLDNSARSRDHQLSYFVSGNEGFQVNLIGLVNDEQGGVYKSARELKEETKKLDQKQFALTLIDPAKVKPKTTKPTPLDKRAITLFRDNSKAGPVLLKSGDKWIAHGAIRATEAKCIKCHEVEKDALLGLFRYEFPASFGTNETPQGE